MPQSRKSQRRQDETRKGQSITIENNNQELGSIEEIFSYENPTIKDILVILKEIFTSQQFIACKYDELLTRNLELETLCNNLTNENLLLKNELNEIKKETQILQETTNDHKIEIHGIPYCQNENVQETVIKIAENFDNQIKMEDIDEAYRRNRRGKDNRTNIPIVVSFVRKSVKEKFLSLRRKRSVYTDEIGLNGVRSQIFVNEYLSKGKK